jgi:DNA helicase-4
LQGRTCYPNLIGRIFGAIRSVETSKDAICISYKNGAEITLESLMLVDFPSSKNGIFGSSLYLQSSEKVQNFPFFPKSVIDELLKHIENKVVSNICSSINEAHNVFLKKAVFEYIRDSSLNEIEVAIGTILSRYYRSKSKWESNLPETALEKLFYWDRYYPLEHGKELLRKELETKSLSSRKSFFDIIESNPLTQQQRLSVIRNNDLNLVLAAAGTGKTSVMVAKALDLIESKAVKNDEILILAYNNAAANELKERVVKRGGIFGISSENAPDISTFHALGRKILQHCNIPTYLSDFADDPIKLKVWVTSWLISYIKSSPRSLTNFIELAHQPVNPFDFQSKGEYDAYVRDNEYRTLQGERVKGYQELIIANWLFMNGVEYEYEAPYITKRRVEIGFDYRPDFHLKNTKIYLEHFGIDRNGNTRKDIDRDNYNSSIKNKRDLHSECDTTLIETFHYNWVEGELEIKLASLMALSGIETNEKSQEDIFDALKNVGFIEESANRYLKCLQAIRVERLEKVSICERLNDNGIIHSEKYTELLDSLHSAYIDELGSQSRIDFDDMIIRSTNAVSSGQFKPKWLHILVDEFQDISKSRMDFLKSLSDYGTNPVLTVVGDDWQSIYRFTGGKLELTTRFEELVGPHTLTKLEKTFRYNNSIAETAGTFVMRNPEQYKKNVTAHLKVDTPQVYLLDSKVGNQNALEDRVVQVLETIKANDLDGSIAILARYRYLLKNTKEKVNDKTGYRNIKYWTFHGSKGLEADYCILIGFFQGKTGFPNMNKEEAVVEALLPSLDSFPHSEERRLLYVAITRAKHKSYLIADPMAPSEFINELLSPKYNIHIGSKTFKEKYRKIFKCPLCTDGYYRLISGKFGDFYSCTSGSVCISKPRVCVRCGAPSIDSQSKSICNNLDCKTEKPICERCGRPMKLRDGKFGKFLGCSGYGIKDDQCTGTRKVV